MRSFDEAMKRIPTQREKIIKALKEAGENGVTTKELNAICFRYGARLNELYKMGYVITKELISNGVYKYVLIKEPSEVKIHSDAQSEILLIVRDQYKNAISAEQLNMLLDHKYFYIIRKPNWYQHQHEKTLKG
jgi:Helix-turn-helix domain